MIPLQKAATLAAKIMEVLRPACQLIEVAGSIRRGLPHVGDLDLVALPHRGAEQDLAALFRSCADTGGLLLDGGIAKRILLRKSRLQCDLWIANHGKDDLLDPIPCNWGGMLLTYTGSKAHNIKLVEHAKTLRKTFRPGWGVIDDRTGTVSSVTEAEIFQALNLPYLAPEDRH